MSFKKVLSALLCALFLITAVVPALADGRPIHQSTKTETITGLGVSAEYYANFIGKYATGEITLTFLPDPSNQLLPGDYDTYVVFDVTDVDNNWEVIGPANHGGMTCSYTVHTTSGANILTATYHYYVNYSPRKTITLS